MRHSVELALSNPSPQLNLVPFPSLQQPLISRPAKIAAIEEMWPKKIDRTCNRRKESANQSPTDGNKTLE
jgi:antitoxin (DNA-binding transcriptional repressor) of toxin-antitoxin stability system